MPSPLLYTHSEAYLAPNGTYVTVGMKPNGVASFFSLLWNMSLRPTWLGGTKRTLKYAFRFLLRLLSHPYSSRSVQVSCVKSELEDLQRFVAEGKNQLKSDWNSCPHLFSGKVKPVVDSVYRFEDALKAYDRIMTSRAVGRVIVEIPGSDWFLVFPRLSPLGRDVCPRILFTKHSNKLFYRRYFVLIQALAVPAQRRHAWKSLESQRLFVLHGETIQRTRLCKDKRAWHWKSCLVTASNIAALRRFSHRSTSPKVFLWIQAMQRLLLFCFTQSTLQ